VEIYLNKRTSSIAPDSLLDSSEIIDDEDDDGSAEIRRSRAETNDTQVKAKKSFTLRRNPKPSPLSVSARNITNETE